MKPEATTIGVQPHAITVDVVSDVVCPWCWIGKRRLEQALREVGGDSVEVRWRPFQLDPSIPNGGLDRKAYVERKFGSAERAAQIYERIRAAGHEVGIPFAFDKITRSPNSLDAHRVIRWAHSAGVQSQVKEALMRRYYVDGADIGDRAVLAATAAENGLDGSLVAKLLDEGADVDVVRKEVEAAVGMGVTGVPFFIIDARFAVPGAQDASVLAAAIGKARTEPRSAMA